MLFVKKSEQKNEWTNWAGNVTAGPEYYHAPKDLQEIQELVDSCRIRGASLRVTGAGHSFSAVAQPDNDSMTLDHLRGLISYDAEAMEARLWAGTYLYEAAPLLETVGMGFENMGDVQVQTIAGAISTGTHGTGITLGSLSNQIVAWTWIDGMGTINYHRRGNDDLSKALSLSLGLLGVLVDVTLKTIPLYSLRVERTRRTFSDALSEWPSDLQSNRHMEWFYFPGTTAVQVKKTNIVPLVRQSKQSKAVDVMKTGLIETAAFKVISEICRIKPSLSRKMTALSASSIPTGVKEGIYHEVLPSPRLVKFTETEYALPLPLFEEVIEEIHHFMLAHPFYVHFPIECRVTAGEDAFLSPTQGEATVFLAFHMYKGMDEQPYFKWVRKLMDRYGGRPHFGKVNNLTADKIKELYPDFKRFMAIKEACDPREVFMSDYMRQLFN